MRLRRFRRFWTPKRILIIITFLLILVYIAVKTPSYLWQYSRSALIEESNLNKYNFVNSKTACLVPKLNPYSTEVLHLMKYTWGKCNVKKYGKIKNGVYVLKLQSSVREAYVQYIRRAPKQNEITNDFNVAFSEKITLVEDEEGTFKLKLEEDHIKVTIKFLFAYHTEYHSHVARKPQSIKKLTEIKSGIPMNIIIKMFDSTSKANFERQAIKSMKFLQNDEDSFVFESNSIVGDGTTAQLSALLTGVAEEDQYETRRNFPNTSTVDDFSWVFNDFKNAGYSTLFTEEDPRFPAFHYRLNGFREPPTTWYLRPFWLAWAQDYLKMRLCAANQNIEFLKAFDEMFNGQAKFGISVTATYVHDDWNSLQNIDDDILDIINYFKKEQNTILILFGDHGSRAGKLRETLQGKMEERLPFISVTMPSFFKTKYPEFYEALKDNTKILTSYFDFHKTFQHILSYPKSPDTKFRGQSLFTKLPLDRTCQSLGIKEHWCACLQYKTLSTSDATVQRVAKFIVDFLNSLVSDVNRVQKRCAVMKLLQVHRAGVQSPNEKVQKFKDSERNNKCDSCGVILDDKVNTDGVSIKNYEIVLSVSPSEGKYEVNARVDLNGKITVDPLISRINMYGDQPKCIASKYPHLRPYCYCI